MATTSAAEWLKGNRDYHVGLEILKENGAAGFIIGLLSTGPDHYNTPKLLHEVELIGHRQAELPAIIPPNVTEISKKVTEQHPEVPAAPVYILNADIERKLRYDQQIRTLWKEICHLHGQLSVLPDGEQLHQVARQILIKNLQKQRLFDELPYFNANGVWFQDAPESQAKPVDLEQAIKNAMANRAKAKGKLNQPLPTFKADYYRNKVAEWDAKIETLKSQRNGNEAAGAQRAA